MNFKVNESETKLRGGYYTAPEIASFLLRWAVRKDATVLLEPSCGDGVFFRTLGGLPDLMTRVSSVLGFEIQPEEASKASAALSDISLPGSVEARDFLNWALKNSMASPGIDAVVGNPPFIRYQYCERDLQERSEEIFRLFRLRFTRHTNAWVPFVIASVALLKPGGRLGMVLPSEILHVLHAQSLRTFLARECSRLLVIDPQEIWFEETLQGAVLLLAERKSPQDPRNGHGLAILPTKGKSILQRDPEQLVRDAHYANGKTISGKWTHALLSHEERALINQLEAAGKAQRFSALADADVGIVTGANKFFLVPDAVVEKYGLNEWAHPMFGRSGHVPGVVYDQAVHNRNREAGLPSNFLWFTGELLDDLPATVQRYILEGQRQSLHTRYKCRIRTPWYAVPSVYATEVGMLKRSHDFPRLIHNRVKAFTTDTAYRIRPKGTVRPKDLVFSFVNSLTALSAELEGRHYGGGVLELVPSEIERLLIPLVDTDEQDLGALDQDLKKGLANGDILRRQDEKVLGRAGLGHAEREMLHAAWSRLRYRRQRRDS